MKGRSGLRCRRADPALAIAALTLALAGCGGENEAPAEDDAATGVAAETDSGGCPLPASSVAELVGDEITGTAFHSGGIGGGNGAGDEQLSISWEGCVYRGARDVDYVLASLVDEQGAPDRDAIDRLPAPEAVPALDELGEKARYDAHQREVVVLDGSRTIAVGLGPFAPEPTGDDLEDLAVIVRDLVASEPQAGIEALCELAGDRTPDRWGDLEPPRLGAGAGFNAEGEELSYETCERDLAELDSGLRLRLGPAELYATTAALGADHSAKPVSGIGAAAAWYGDRLFFTTGESSYVAGGRDGRHEPVDPAILESLAAGAAAELGG